MSRTVIIVDDHTLFAQSLVSLIHSFENFEVTAVFKTGQELVDYFSQGNPVPDIVLLDVRMPVMNGVETMLWLKENLPDQKVLALTMEHDEETIIKMIKLGCRGYLLKDIEPEEFLDALAAIHDT
ncbi:response regulator transcription factor [Antarcticibacterium sp. 1MA-6-2]|uniref:response regulator n=1 Tax=Antarcticibacterium sp. 1MA-6-2 TaxID=2908210 RepID=UPI002882E495|nr:response regulator transcription factor [Antarcticibacterium sp. 1MA-6-2]